MITEGFIVEQTQVLFPNFSGNQIPGFNKEGDRNFCIGLTKKMADDLARDGWNVKQLKEREDGTPGDYFIKVTVKFTNRPPVIYLVTSTGKKLITEATVSVLDAVDIKYIDVICTPYNWETATGSGVSAYLKKAYVMMDEDELDRKYAYLDEGQGE